jgi:subtilisin family serine protease
MLPKAIQARVSIRAPRAIPDILTLDVPDGAAELVDIYRREGLDVYEDFAFDHFDDPRYWRPTPSTSSASGPVPNLRDVLDHIRAPQIWNRTKGQGTTIVVIDTGVCDSRPEFPAHRRHSLDIASRFQGAHWHDPEGHGSMCAAIAAGSGSGHGGVDGVAPEATLLAARTTLMAGDILDIYDDLLSARSDGRLTDPVVISNSYGHQVCQPPVWSPKHPYMDGIRSAVAAGMVVVFAAGNNHHSVCGHPPGSSGPNSIWGPNSADEVISVGTVDRNERNDDPAHPHVDSSRGPGQWASIGTKPDCVAPTYGTVVWGCGTMDMEWWGTSGACPQVAGLAALIQSATGGILSPAQVGDVIRRTCRSLAAPPTQIGAGIIDCAAAVNEALDIVSRSPRGS